MADELKKPDLTDPTPENQIAPENQVAPETPSNPPPAIDTAATELQTQRVLSASEISTWLEGENKDPETLTRLLDEYLQAIQFIDPSITPDKIAEVIYYATEERAGNNDRRISPIPSDIAARMRALLDLKESGRSINVAAINVGGTNTTATIATVQHGKITLKEIAKRSFRKTEEEGRPIQCVDHIDYWERTIPPEFIEKLKTITETENAQLAIEIAIAAPTRDGYADHMSDKAIFEKDPLAPANETESREVGRNRSRYPTIAQSFSKFLERKEINIPPESIFIGENDTINIVIGRPAEAVKILKKRETINGAGGVVVGTGFNACAFRRDGRGYNYEIGHLGFENPCVIDKAVSEEAGIDLDIESCVSGKILGNVLKATVKELTGTSSDLQQLIQSLDKAALNALIFNPEQQFDALSENEKTLLRKVCSRFAERAAQYIAAVLEGISMSIGGDMGFIKEGSVVDKNPKLVERINLIAGKDILLNLGSIQAEDQTSQGIDVNNLSPSFYGAINDAAAKAYLARK